MEVSFSASAAQAAAMQQMQVAVLRMALDTARSQAAVAVPPGAPADLAGIAVATDGLRGLHLDVSA